MSEKIIAEILEKQKQLVAKSYHLGYKNALNELLGEVRLKLADGFIISESLVGELMEMLLEKQNGK